MIPRCHPFYGRRPCSGRSHGPSTQKGPGSPGPFQRIAESLLGERVAELDKIKCSLLAFAGERDSLVPPEVAAKSVDIVASTDTDFRVAPGGHMGVSIGSKAQNAVWAESAEWLASRSGTQPRKKPAARRRKAAVKTKRRAKARPKAKRGRAKARATAA